MAKLYFRHGAMGCGKTAHAIMVAFNYEEKGLKPLVIKPALENRDGANMIGSRIGLKRECSFVEDYIFPDDEDKTLELTKAFDCVIIDEVQFCTPEQIKMLPKIVLYNKIPVICYGLTTDFLLNPFAGAKELMIMPGLVKEELKTVCWCGEGANCNARLDDDGNVVRVGEQICLGGNERYTSLCYEHYLSGDIGPKMRAKFRNKN